MSQSGSGQGSLSEDSTDSRSGSTTTTTKPKIDFGKKHRKVVRILTVVAYIISVSTAAVLLSAYYVFLWNPSPSSTDKRASSESPTTLALARQLTQNSDDDNHHESSFDNSFDLFPSSLIKHEKEMIDNHPPINYKSSTSNDPQQIPTPNSIHSQSFIIQNILTTPLPKTLSLSSSSSSLLSLLSPSNIPPTTRKIATQSLLLTNIIPPSSTNSILNPSHRDGQQEGN